MKNLVWGLIVVAASNVATAEPALPEWLSTNDISKRMFAPVDVCATKSGEVDPDFMEQLAKKETEAITTVMDQIKDLGTISGTEQQDNLNELMNTYTDTYNALVKDRMASQDCSRLPFPPAPHRMDKSKKYWSKYKISQPALEYTKDIVVVRYWSYITEFNNMPFVATMIDPNYAKIIGTYHGLKGYTFEAKEVDLAVYSERVALAKQAFEQGMKPELIPAAINKYLEERERQKIPTPGVVPTAP